MYRRQAGMKVLVQHILCSFRAGQSPVRQANTGYCQSRDSPHKTWRTNITNTIGDDQIRVVASRRFGTLSPLRYPGGKAALAGLFEDLVRAMRMKKSRYVEPYAGGAGAGIALLREGIVEELVINDIDPAVHAFWLSVTEHNSDFIKRVQTVDLTINEWQKQRQIYKRGDQSNPIALGFSFFFLNRTNRSGILHAGVIGGQDQTGNYKIDARFNRTTLSDRLSEIGKIAERITISDLDGRDVIQKYGREKNTFMYIDPPYVKAGSQLYLNSFERRDHIALAEIVNDIQDASWLMTYDTAPIIEKLYDKHFQCRLTMNYSARNSGLKDELLVASPRTAIALKSLTHLFAESV